MALQGECALDMILRLCPDSRLQCPGVQCSVSAGSRFQNMQLWGHIRLTFDAAASLYGCDIGDITSFAVQDRAVDGICAVGGLRAQPSREDLRVFVENVASLNGARVAELLQVKMVRNTGSAMHSNILCCCWTCCSIIELKGRRVQCTGDLLFVLLLQSR